MVVVVVVVVVVVFGEVGNGIDSGPSPGEHEAETIIAVTIATRLQRTRAIVPDRLRRSAATLRGDADG